jgi:hypothetical protein
VFFPLQAFQPEILIHISSTHGAVGSPHCHCPWFYWRDNRPFGEEYKLGSSHWSFLQSLSPHPSCLFSQALCSQNTRNWCTNCLYRPPKECFLCSLSWHCFMTDGG